MRVLLFTGFLLVVAGVVHCATPLPSTRTNSTSSIRKDSSSDASESPTGIQRRTSKDLLKTLDVNNSNSSVTKSVLEKRSPGKVEILEAGSTVRSRGEPRIIKRGPPAVGRLSSDSIFNLRNSLKAKQAARGLTRSNSGYGVASQTGSSSDGYDEYPNIPVISIPGSHIPPPVYTYDASPASPPGSGHPSPTFVSYKPTGGSGGGGIVLSTTAPPDFVIPPEVVTPEVGPFPIGPGSGSGSGTSIPIIGSGGGGSGGGGNGAVFPPSPPEDIFPPAPPSEDEDADGVDILGGDDLEGEIEEQEEEVDVGRRLKVKSGNVGGTRNIGGSVRTRTRVIPTSRPSSRFKVSSTESSSPVRAGLRGGVLRRERLRDKVKGFKTNLREEEEPESEEIIVDDPNVITDFVFSDIKCFKTRQNEYFGATIHMKNGFHLPYIRDRPQDPLSSDECHLEPVEGTRGSYHMSVTDLRGCGVEQCGEAMCLTMVFPRVPMLALADDEVTTIKCTPQRSTMSDTKSISFAGDSMENRRSSSTVEGGIQEFVAEVGVFRQNPGATNGLFVKRVNSGGVVQLGEPLQLRSVVRGTDGWKHSRLTDVKVWRMRENMSSRIENLNPDQASEVITLVDAQGCRNDEYVVIADDHPIKDPRNDMVHHFTFKAFLFRGQRVNEPLIVTARVHACQESQDCIMECEGKRHRVKRSPVEIHNASAIVHDFDSQLTLRVVGLKDHPSSFLDDEFSFDHATGRNYSNRTSVDSGTMTCNDKMIATGIGGGCLMLLICGLALALYTYIRQGRIHSKNSSSSAASRRYPYPPPGRLAGNNPYHKPLPPPPPSTQQQQPPPPPAKQNSALDQNGNSNSMNADISQVAKLLQQLANNDGNKANGGATGKTKNESKHQSEPTSEYACIADENSSTSTSSEDLSTGNKKDGVYIVYYNVNKDKKNKIMLPMSAPSSMRMRRKHLKHNEMDDDDDEDDVDFIDEDDSEALGSQTEEATEESDDSYDVGNGNSGNSNIGKNQGCRRTVRSVKKKSKQNNNLAYASTRSGIRRRVSSVYREGYLHGVRGGNGRGGSFPLRYKKSPSTGNIPAAAASGYSNNSQISGSTKRIRFSVRERRGKRNQKHNSELYSSEGMISEGTTMASDLDSAYSGSNCSKLTEDRLYELKRGGMNAASVRYPDFRNVHKLQNLLDIQRQLRNEAQGQKHQQKFLEKQEIRRTCSSNTTVPVGLDSPPLPLGETKATHFVTRDESSTKILIVPETHV